MDGDTVVLSWRPINFAQIMIMVLIIWLLLALFGQGWRAWQNRSAAN